MKTENDIIHNAIDITRDLDDETIKNFRDAISNPIRLQTRLQIFKTIIYNGDVQEAIERHRLEILNSIVYSMFSEMDVPTYSDKLYCMSGFKERTGRLPDKNDRIRVIRGADWLHQGFDYIGSEVGFEIINEK